MQERMSSNLTDDQWLSAYYRHYKYDLNNKTIPNAMKLRRKPALDIRLKSKRRKFEQQRHQQQTNSLLPEKFINDPTLTSSLPTTTTETKDITATTTTTVASATEAASGTSSLISTVESTTAGITKSIDELPANNNYVGRTTSETDTHAKINNRMNVNDVDTNGINGILSSSTTTTTPLPKPTPSTPALSTTEHSITYNVTVNDLKRVQQKSRRISNAGWGRWQKWTKCSRSCGGGVMSQSRLCLSR